jgi:hypothetical protein
MKDFPTLIAVLTFAHSEVLVQYNMIVVTFEISVVNQLHFSAHETSFNHRHGVGEYSSMDAKS